MSRRVVLAMAAALATAIAVVYGQVLIGGVAFGAGEHVFEALPSASHLAARIAAFDVPEWWDAVGLGVPFAANPQHAALYPPAYLAAALPMPWGLDALVVLHFVVAGLGAALWSRRLGADPFSAVVAGAALAASGPTLALLEVHGVVYATTWLPWIAWSADRIAAGDRLRGALWLASTAAACWLAGGLTALVAAVIAIATAVAARRSWSAAQADAARAELLASVGVSPAPTRVAPRPPSSPGSARAVIDPDDSARGVFGAVGCAVAASLLLAAVSLVPALVADAVFGARGPASSAGDLAGVLWPRDSARAFLGVPLVTFALFGAWTASRRGPVLVVAALSCALAAWLGVAGQAPTLLAAAALCTSVAAGLGVAALARDRVRFFRVAVALAIVVAVVAAIDTALGGGARGLPSALAMIAVAAACAPWSRLASVALPLCAMAAVGPLAWEVQGAPGIDRALLAEPPSLVATAIDRGDLRLSRPERLPGEGSDDLAERYRLAGANSATRFGLRYLRGRDALIDPRLAELWTRGAATGERVLDLLGADLAALPRSVALPSGLPVVAVVDDVALVDNPHRRPRAFTTARWRYYRDDDALLDDVFPAARDMRPGLGLATVRLIGSGDDAADSDAPAPLRPCERSASSGERVELRCNAEAPGFAVLLDTHAAGWRAEVDGRPARVERADVLVRAVAVDAGEHRIVFRYRSPGLVLGAAVSALALANWLLLLVWLRRR